ncbi:diacylglycerol kinase family protein [Listeria booriae]|uniref:diacylglycerol kinase family protein n=1 Tax=Listeria booriae TaxID=1552123 RepID=UPI0016270C32|nr:diacylglycerol kinase family protein [Listeria booriae]MBC1974799.1 diacylglycerol kinase family protein [Listeria booriae]MBC1982838.1 diacylglycerol kinase family protein [Listeria booriae]MBC2032091.1 diacylglycerol kinase family protein [Listeria booriae]MBC2046494.1 diacylglycerol kinase family protein [Listeria booriae]MBC2163174.1 diacylglycerol kinase family protein [Listeria booriae]
MRMDSKDRVKATANRRFRKSFIHAVTGVKTAILEERHMRVHITAGMIVVICGVFFKVTKIEWLFLLLSIFNVLTFEMINTAIERAVDVATEEFHPYAKKAKDVAAGAVLLASICSAVVGLIIFIPKLF